MGFISGCSSVSFAPNITITPGAALLLPGQSIQFSATVNGHPLTNPIWTVNKVTGGAAASGTITSSGLYTAPTGTPSSEIQVNVTDSDHNIGATPASISIFQRNQFSPGAVTASNNPLVALYAFSVPEGGTVQVQFGTTTSYGLTTWSQPAPDGGGEVDIEVAGMRASTTYHMQAVAHLADGSTLFDNDQSFTTGDLPADLLPNLTIQQTPGLNPAPGVELLCLFEGGQTLLTAVVTDLAGNVIWYYPMQPLSPFPMKLLPNGHMLILESGVNIVQEIDLAGNVISQVSLSDIQQGLTAAGISFPQLTGMDHDLVKLPNGHLVIVVSTTETVSGPSGDMTVGGSGLIDWDPQQGPVWTWSAFDHIPLTHAPFGTQDWTHANAVIYSPDDGDLIFSMRNQDWIVKINYQNGAGDGSILWRLGPEGDFTLPAGQAPLEWNYGQHYPVLVGSNSSGIFPLMFFNNGNNRLVDSANDVCGTMGLTPCYSSVPIFELNEYTKTAQVLKEINLSPAYSTCCGSTNILSNQDLEYDIAFDVNKPNLSYIEEVTPDAQPQLVWQMNIAGQLAYRGFRIPSLYPGVEWTQSELATANSAAKPHRTRKLVKR